VVLRFFYRTDGDNPGPLIAEAFIEGQCSDENGFPWPEGKIQFFAVNLAALGINGLRK